MIKIAITGVMGSGKTTIAALLGELGIPVIDADRISREAVKSGTAAYAAIVKAFGPAIVGKDDEIDRRRLAAVVFADSSKKKLLESIVHPAVYEKRDAMLKEMAQKNPEAVVALDIPLLFEAGLEKTVDYIICAFADEETLYKRVKKRDNLTIDEFKARLKNQMPLDEKAKKSHFTVDTRKDTGTLKSELKDILAKITKQATKA